MTLSCSQELAEYVLDLNIRNVPSDVLDQAKYAVMDALGINLAGVRIGEPAITCISSAVYSRGGKGESTVFGRKRKIPSMNAAIANSAVTRSVRLDDVHLGAVVHVGGGLVPAVLAVGEVVGAKGNDILSAVIAAYDIVGRMGRSMGILYKRGFSPTSIIGPIAFGAAAGRVLKLSKEKLVDAIGIGAALGCGLANQRGATSTMYQQIKAAQSGVEAAVMADAGIKGCPTILEDDTGFCKSFAGNPDLQELTKDLGSRFEILRTMFRMYPCETFIHPALEAYIAIARSNGIGFDDVQHVEVQVVPETLPRIGFEGMPKNKTEARASTRFIIANVARVMEKIRLNLDIYSQDVFKDPEIESFIGKVDVVPEVELFRPSAEDWVARVRVDTKDGRGFSLERDRVKGTFKDPFTKEDHEFKFRKLAGYSLKEDVVNEVFIMISNLESLENINQLITMINKNIVLCV